MVNIPKEAHDLDGLTPENARELIMALRKLQFWGFLSAARTNAYTKHVERWELA